MTSNIEQLCVAKGLKMTGQRKVIAKVISDAKDHPDVEEILKRAVNADPNISIATVYRTLRMFENEDIVKKHDFGDGRARYEKASSDRHHHLIDIRSGRVTEFKDDEISEMLDKIAKKLGYKMVDHRIEIYGVKK